MGRTPIIARSPKKLIQQFPRVTKTSKSVHKTKKPFGTLKLEAKEKKDWEDAMCSVCMERPHNAVLLLCSSHEKGCRPYMCATGPRLSNCLAQFKKSYSKDQNQIDCSIAGVGLGKESAQAVELACPLCRGQVKGWTVVAPARKYLNRKKRNCAHDNCSFRGSYKQHRNHIRAAHPAVRTRQVDPVQEQKWRSMEREREREDVMSAIRSAMPHSMVFGDYVIDMNSSDNPTDTDSEAGDDRGRGDGRGRGDSRNLFYFFLREGARLMRMGRGRGHRESTNGERRVAVEGNTLDNAIDLDSDEVESDDLSRNENVRIRPRIPQGRRRRPGRRVRLL